MTLVGVQAAVTVTVVIALTVVVAVTVVVIRGQAEVDVDVVEVEVVTQPPNRQVHALETLEGPHVGLMKVGKALAVLMVVVYVAQKPDA
jgi:hypothetical protein